MSTYTRDNLITLTLEAKIWMEHGFKHLIQKGPPPKKQISITMTIRDWGIAVTEIRLKRPCNIKDSSNVIEMIRNRKTCGWTNYSAIFVPRGQTPDNSWRYPGFSDVEKLAFCRAWLADTRYEAC